MVIEIEVRRANQLEVWLAFRKSNENEGEKY